MNLDAYSSMPEVWLERPDSSGPAALLIHGFGSDRTSWIVNQSEIASAMPVASIDLPGHGSSGFDVGDGRIATLAGKVATALDRGQLRGLHLVGHSLGGGVALALAAQRPDLVRSLVLIAPIGLGQRVERDFLDGFPELSDADDAMRLLQRLVVRPRLINKMLARRAIDQLARPQARASLKLIAAALAADDEALASYAAQAATRGVPRLAIWGRDDRINPLCAEKLAEWGGETLIVDHAGHLPHVENPRVVNASVTKFLSQSC